MITPEEIAENAVANMGDIFTDAPEVLDPRGQAFEAIVEALQPYDVTVSAQ